MTVQLTFDDDPPITGLPDEGSQTKQYEAAPGLGHAEVTPEPVGSGPVVEADYSLPLITTPDVTTVEAGGTVTVEGSGLAASSTGTLSLVAADGTVLAETEVTADATGAIPATALEVPADAVAGDYTLTLAGGAVVIDNVTITVGGEPPVEPEVSADVTEVAPGGTVTALGTGFPAETEGTVGLYDSADQPVVEEPVTTDADGAFTDIALVVPAETIPSELALRATIGDATSPDVTITVTEEPAEPTIEATPDTIDSSGDETARTINVTGTGFEPDTAGTVQLLTGEPGSGGEEVVGADITTDADGAFADTAIVVPEATEAGDYHLVATAGESVSDDTPITVTSEPAPDAELTPDVTEVEAGGTVTVTGTGFPADTAGRIGLFDADDTEVVGADATSGSDGAVAETPLVVPAETPAGDLALRGVFGDAVSPDVAITVTEAPAPEPTVTPDVTTVAPGGVVTAAGTGFPAETAGTVGLFDADDAAVGDPVDVTTDADGAFTDAAITVPAEQAEGDLALRGTVGDVTAPDVAITVAAAEAATTRKARKKK